MAKAAISKSTVANVFTLPTDELLTMFADYNPRIHTEEDVNRTAESLLSFGWLTVVCVNLETKTIVGGHARTLSADFLRQQTSDWFQLKYEEWLEVNPDRRVMAATSRSRFTPDFWESVPCVGAALDKSSEKSANIRLNSTTFEGKSDSAKVAALLAQLPPALQQSASFTPALARSYIDAYLERTPTTPQVEFQPKQYFSRPDATVYDAQGEQVDAETLAATDHIPEDWTVEVEGQSYTVDELEEQHQVDQEQAIALDDLDLDGLDSSEFRGASVDKDIAETRIVLLVSKADLQEYNEKIGAIALWSNVSMEGSSKLWKPKTIMTLVRSAYTMATKETGNTENS